MTTPGARSAPACDSPTQADPVRRNRGAWREEGQEGSNPFPSTHAMSQDTGMTVKSHLGPGSFWLRAGWVSGGLVVAGGVDGEFAEELSGGGVDDADAQTDGVW
jgi:hypothetical protein